ncbi:MAG: hypothetical protein ABW032_07505 [Burkholderiaceae bacterium]
MKLKDMRAICKVFSERRDGQDGVLLTAAAKALFDLRGRVPDDDFMQAVDEFFGAVEASEAHAQAVCEMLYALPLVDLQMPEAAKQRLFDKIVALAHRKLAAGRQRSNFLSDRRNALIGFLSDEEYEHDRLIELRDGAPPPLPRGRACGVAALHKRPAADPASALARPAWPAGFELHRRGKRRRRWRSAGCPGGQAL